MLVRDPPRHASGAVGASRRGVRRLAVRDPDRVSTKSRIGEKLAYFVNHWDGLRVFLADGRIGMDSNPVEKTIRPLTPNRKNALVAGHDEGGRSWARIASLVETCYLNGTEPFAYLKVALEAITAGHPAARIEELLPCNFQIAST